MSFGTINRCANDGAFMGRVIACLAGEGETNPASQVGLVIWPVSAASDIAAAYASAIAANNPDPGGDESVITDQMILSAVQANLPLST
jgi:hypothetical protein